MKKTIYLLMGLVAALPAFNSCSDEEFLTEEPKTIYTKENAFEKSTQVDAALVRAYIKFNGMNTLNNGFVGGGDAASNLLKGDGSDLLGGTRGSGAAGSFSNFWNLKTDNSAFLSVWNSMYQLSAYANLALDGLDIIEGLSDDEAKYLEAQANFFKGWAYLRLGEMFGGVPIQDRLSEDLKFDYERTTRAETYDYAIGLLESAAAGLPQFPKESGRLSQGEANHFLAEAYLARAIETGNAADYDKSISAANSVIADHPLMMSRFGSRSEFGSTPKGVVENGVERYQPEGNAYWDLFQIGNVAYGANGNTESLMILEQPAYDKWSVYGGSMNTFQVTVGPAYRDATWAPSIASQGGPWKGTHMDYNRFPGGQIGIHLTCSWGLIASMDYADEYVWEGDLANDDRNSQIVLWTPVVMDMDSPLYLQPTTKDMLLDPAYHARVSCKITTQDLWGWDTEHSPGMGSSFYRAFSRDWYITRSAETYLLRAEAKLRKGDKAGAAEDINMLRKRANCTKLFDGSEVTLFTILDERARELTWEELRWPTLLRMGKGGQESKGENPTMREQLSQHTFSAEILPDQFKGKQLPDWTLFPIPFNVIQLNSEVELQQNYGW